MSKYIIKLSERKIDFVVNQLNKVLDEEGIIGAEWNRQVLKAFIIDNIYSTENLTKLIDELKQVEEYNKKIKEDK